MNSREQYDKAAEFAELIVTLNKALKSLKEISELKGQTLLGQCCVEKNCRAYSNVNFCEVQYKSAMAFAQAAFIAKNAIDEISQELISQAEGK